MSNDNGPERRWSALKFRTRMNQYEDTQRALAEACGVTEAAVSRWRRLGISPHPRTRPKIAKALGCTLDDLTVEVRA